MSLRRLLSLVVLLPGLSGCLVWVDDTEDLRRYVRNIRDLPAPPIEPLPAYKPYESFVYEGASLREPFQPLALPDPVAEALVINQGGGLSATRPDEARSKDYLEEFSIDDLVMVGTIKRFGEAGDKLWALIKDTRGAIHRVSEGQYMGLDFGEVINVDERKLELIEIVSNGRGGWMKRSRTIVLASGSTGESSH